MPVVTAPAAGFDPTQIKAAIAKLLPFLKLVAAITPNPYDNLIVALLEAWAANPASLEAAVAATNAASP